MKERIRELLKETTLPCLMVTAKPCIPGPMVSTDSSKCATLDGSPVSLTDIHKVVKFTSNPNTYKIAGMSVNPMGNGSDNITTTTSPCGCDSSLWSNHQNWINNWTGLPNFSSSNPNQPCNHVCQRKTLWSGQVPNVGPIWANMLLCKLEEVENQITIHGCSC